MCPPIVLTHDALLLAECFHWLERNRWLASVHVFVASSEKKKFSFAAARTSTQSTAVDSRGSCCGTESLATVDCELNKAVAVDPTDTISISFIVFISNFILTQKSQLFHCFYSFIHLSRASPMFVYYWNRVSSPLWRCTQKLQFILFITFEHCYVFLTDDHPQCFTFYCLS